MADMKQNNVKLKNYHEHKKQFANLVQNGASDEEQSKAFGAMFDALSNDLQEEITAEINNRVVDNGILAKRSQDPLTSEERKFFNDINYDVGYTDEKILPETVVERVFDDLQKDHPLLSKINFQNAGIKTRVIKADPAGQAVWGKVFGEIKGQLDAAFREENFTQYKLTCFVVLPDDLSTFGPAWIERFVRTQIQEAISVALESAIINGGGAAKTQPVGLMKDVNTNSGAVTDKASSGTLTFADADTTILELNDVLKNLSVDEKGKELKIDGKVALVVNPRDSWDVQARYTYLTANGGFVTVLPYNVTIITSEFVPEGKLVAFVTDRYNAVRGGGLTVKKFDQTLALEDAVLFTAKTFAYGQPDDNKASAVYDLKVASAPRRQTSAGGTTDGIAEA
ncbi:phage major capsid protein [Staphylococcus pseudintermedius]|uniref:ORF009 n=1 Tax=Staphylococcus phage 2638A TaxID=320836 RepID=Q4ZD74_BP263|nr:phage major capsid protein [Staphylococcus pseudintermedius]YP_239802.1 major capsid protein [Staphylococcus phage 2638A]AZB66728.1 major capsid protein [Staphylococcus phage phiSP119-1]AAX90997.1 ORF009 [Staphylococcus phage 2638A]EGQ0290628.1 phage major capsid protein [Staphylococcus pseudintermedius]EGQ0300016.1 phage major capsid protein [Staphylococcus pseudintermedius]EGQ0364167.1 phage major capsid protein [Staphylococcus pseudintermedius]